MDRFEYGASYWRRARPGGLGVEFRDLTAEEKGKLGSNKGVVISGVMRGGAAYNADLVPGDVIRSMNQSPVTDFWSFADILDRSMGKSVEFSVWRNGNLIEKTIFIPKRQ